MWVVFRLPVVFICFKTVSCVNSAVVIDIPVWRSRITVSDAAMKGGVIKLGIRFGYRRAKHSIAGSTWVLRCFWVYFKVKGRSVVDRQGRWAVRTIVWMALLHLVVKVVRDLPPSTRQTVPPGLWLVLGRSLSPVPFLPEGTLLSDAAYIFYPSLPFTCSLSLFAFSSLSLSFHYYPPFPTLH